MDGNIFMDYPNLNPDGYVIYESDTEPQYPIYDAKSNSIIISRETTILAYGVMDLLREGGLVEDGEIVVVEASRELVSPQWNGSEWIEAYTQEEINEETDRIKEEVLSTGFYGEIRM